MWHVYNLENYFIIHLYGLNLDVAKGKFTAWLPPEKEKKPLGRENRPERN